MRAGDDPAEIVLIPIAGTIHTENDDPGLKVQVQNSGHLSLVTVFLTGEWVGAELSILENRLVMYGPQKIELPIP